MYIFVKEELIVKILGYYNINYSLLSLDTQALIIYLSNIFYVICFAIILISLWKFICRWF